MTYGLVKTFGIGKSAGKEPKYGSPSTTAL